MRDWHNALQSKSMRNVTLAIFLANAVGIYAVQVRMNQPLPDTLGSEGAPQTVASRELDAGLPSLPAPTGAARTPIGPVAPKFAALTPNIAAEALPQAPADETADAEPVVVQKAASAPVRMASVNTRISTHAQSTSFSAAFAGMDTGTSGAATASANLGTSAGLAAPTGSEPTLSDQTASQPATVAGLPRGPDAGELPPVDGHGDAPATAPANSGADAPPVILGA